MDLQLRHKLALVTASAGGIDLAIEGARVIVNGRSQDRVKQAVASIKADHATAQLEELTADLSTKGGADKTVTRFPEIDILVNNLGIYEVKAFEKTADEDWYRLFETNVMSGVRLARQYFPKMLERGWGRVIFIASESGVMTLSEMIHYGMTKSAQLAIAHGLARLTKGTSVTVNTVMPGPTRSEGIMGFIQDYAKEHGLNLEQAESEFMKEGRPISLIQRLIDPEEVADMVAFLASPRASVTNGTAIRVEGGLIPTML